MESFPTKMGHVRLVSLEKITMACGLLKLLDNVLKNREEKCFPPEGSVNNPKIHLIQHLVHLNKSSYPERKRTGYLLDVEKKLLDDEE
ncbi:hypothetical protein Tco_1509300 [Tanacetum coccineum]